MSLGPKTKSLNKTYINQNTNACTRFHPLPTHTKPYTYITPTHIFRNSCRHASQRPLRLKDKTLDITLQFFFHLFSWNLQIRCGFRLIQRRIVAIFFTYWLSLISM